jgi:hypothetical protein
MKIILIVVSILTGQITLAQPATFKPTNYNCGNEHSYPEKTFTLEKQSDQTYNLTYNQFEGSGFFDGYISTEKGAGEKVRCDFENPIPDDSRPYKATCYKTDTGELILETAVLYSKEGVLKVIFALHEFNGKKLYGNSFSINQCEIK